jgi:hypothetical protein
MNETMKALLQEAQNSEPPMFHPIDERSVGAWFPSNEAAGLVVIISHAWEDLILLAGIRNKSTQDRERRLLFKHALIELRSILEQFEKLQSLSFQTINSRKKENCCYISESEIAKLKVVLKEYHSRKRLVEHDLLAIRNSIGAHRGAHPWEIIGLWDKLTPDVFRPLLRIIPRLFEVIRKLDIYDWTRTPEKGTIEIYCSGLKDIEPW